jgi:hypothetical protein
MQQGSQSSVTDTDSFNPDPAVQVNPDPDPGFDDQKLKQIQMKIFYIYIFLIKIAVYLSLGLHKGRPSYRRSLQPSKENILHFKHENSLLFSTFVGHFCLPGSGSGSWDPISSGSASLAIFSTGTTV